jgi:hypothetical protein
VASPLPDAAAAAASPDAYAVAPDIVERRVADELEPYDPRERTARLADDARDRAEALLSGRTDATAPRVADYDDPFALPGMEPSDG